MRILVLGGGNSPEREVSLRSSAAVRDALTDLGHSVFFVDPADGDEAVLKGAAQVEIIFPILHGVGGEDGQIQRLLDSTGKPYLGSGASASELCFDKVRLRELVNAHAITTPRGEVVSAENFSDSPLIRRPFVLKPIAGGSSLDTLIVRSLPFESNRAYALLSKYSSMLLEELINGTEITVPVLGDTPLPVIEIVPPSGKEFDYENKYNGATAEICPPKNVGSDLQVKAQSLAIKVHQLAGARHLSRTDMMIDHTGKIFVLEINTMPGMTNQSLLPKSAAVSGLNWTTLVGRFVDMLKD